MLRTLAARRFFPAPLRFMSTSTAPSTPAVLFTRDQSIQKIILNRPQAYNALNLQMVEVMLKEMRTLQESSVSKVIVIENDPECKAFCAGGDVKTIVTQASKKDFKSALAFFEEEYKLNHILGTSEVPVISILNGITMGGGVGISVHGHFRVVTEKTVFAMPETAIGLYPDVGGSFFLPRMDGYLGYYLGLTGNRLVGSDVYFAGIGTHYIPSERLPSLKAALAELDSPSPYVINGILDEFSENFPLEKWQDWTYGGKTFDAINRCFKFDTMPEIVKALEKEGTSWAAAQLKTLKTMCPLSLMVTLKQLKRGANLDFAGCFEMERELVGKFLKDSNFIMGVTSKLIEKSRKMPEWNPSWEAMIREDNKKWLNKYFPRLSFSLNMASFAVTEKRLHLKPTFMEYPHRYLSGLPSNRDVMQVVEDLKAKKARNTPLFESEVIDWFELNWGTLKEDSTAFLRMGRGRPGLAEKVKVLLSHYVDVGPNGTLTLRKPGPSSAKI